MRRWRQSLVRLAVAGWLLSASCSAEEAKDEGARIRELPPARTEGTVSVESAIAARRSVRSFEDSPLSEQEISQLLWAAQGITDKARGRRAAPSAGATFPLETYLVTAEGVFRYLPDRHALEQVKAGDHRPELAEAALGQPWVREAPATIAFAAVPERTTGKYGRRGTLYIHMEAGHAAQNVHLQAVALGLGSVPVGAMDDARAAKLLGCRGREEVLYLVPVGKPK